MGFALTTCFPASGQLAVSSVVELAEQASHIYVTRVDELFDPKLRDEAGQAVLLAIATVETTIKGEMRKEVVFAFKPKVSDQARFSAGERYLVFTSGPHRSFVMDHQPVALRIEGTEVEMELLRSERRRQQLDSVLDRIRSAAKR